LKKIKSKAKITGISVCLPKYKYKNLDYPHQTKEKLERFISLSGIRERRIVNNTKTCTSDLAFKAVKKLMSDLKWKTSDIDFLIFITQTSDYLTPASSIILQDRLKLNKNLYAFDINLGCSAFPYGISTAFSLIDNLSFKKGILIMGDVSSRLCNFKDKGSWLLFGDACSAIGFERQKKTSTSFFDFFSDGKGYKDIIVPSHSLTGRNKLVPKDFKNFKIDNNLKSNLNMSLNGPNIYSFSTSIIPQKLKTFLKKSKVEKNKIKYCFLHQANKLINKSIEEKLFLKNTIFPSSLNKYGNTSSASIPVTIVERFGGKKMSGMSLISGFGVGLSSSTLLYDFKDCKISKFVFYS
jgi:3-oxoacyl-[acyl-carrier-protein] synthase-3